MTAAQLRALKRFQKRTSHPLTVLEGDQADGAMSSGETGAIVIRTSFPAMRLIIDPSGKLIQTVPERPADGPSPPWQPLPVRPDAEPLKTAAQKRRRRGRYHR
jgi:hypothetical protein